MRSAVERFPEQIVISTVEFGAFGVDVDVAWRDGGRIRATGNSFAAPHLAGQAARLRSRYPDASPFEIKALLAATAGRVA